MWACHSSRAFVSLLRRTIFSFSCITKFSLFCRALFSLFCPAIISFSCVPVHEAATDRVKRVVGSKTTYFVLSYKLRFFLSEDQENRFEYLANTFNLHNVVISEKYPRLARVLAARYQQSKRYGIYGIYFSFAKGARLSLMLARRLSSCGGSLRYPEPQKKAALSPERLSHITKEG